MNPVKTKVLARALSILVAVAMCARATPAAGAEVYMACHAYPPGRQAIAISPIIVIDDKNLFDIEKADRLALYEAQNGVPMAQGSWGGENTQTEFINFEGDPTNWGKAGTDSRRTCWKSSSRDNISRWYLERRGRPNNSPWLTGLLDDWRPVSGDFIRFEEWPVN